MVGQIIIKWVTSNVFPSVGYSDFFCILYNVHVRTLHTKYVKRESVVFIIFIPFLSLNLLNVIQVSKTCEFIELEKELTSLIEKFS